MQWISNTFHCHSFSLFHNLAAPDCTIAGLLTLSEGYTVSLSSQETVLFEILEPELAILSLSGGSACLQTTSFHTTLQTGSALALTTFQGTCSLQASADCTMTILIFSGTLCKPILEDCLQKQQIFFPNSLHSIHVFLAALPQDADTIDETALSIAAYQLLLTLRKSAQILSSPQPYPLVVEAALNLIQEEYAFLESVSDLAARVEVSVGHLTRQFQQYLGISPGRCLTQFRIAHAKRLLKQKELPMTLIADLCGFSNANYFAKVFRQEVGVSPSVYAQAFSAPDASPPADWSVL